MRGQEGRPDGVCREAAPRIVDHCCRPPFLVRRESRVGEALGHRVWCAAVARARLGNLGHHRRRRRPPENEQARWQRIRRRHRQPSPSSTSATSRRRRRKRLSPLTHCRSLPFLPPVGTLARSGADSGSRDIPPEADDPPPRSAPATPPKDAVDAVRPKEDSADLTLDRHTITTPATTTATGEEGELDFSDLKRKKKKKSVALDLDDVDGERGSGTATPDVGADEFAGKSSSGVVLLIIHRLMHPHLARRFGEEQEEEEGQEGV